MSRCQRTLRGEGHGAAGWGIVGSVWLQTVRSKVRSFGQWAAATCAVPPVSFPVSTPLRIVNHCWSGFPCKWWYINVATFNLLICRGRTMVRSHDLFAASHLHANQHHVTQLLCCGLLQIHTYIYNSTSLFKKYVTTFNSVHLSKRQAWLNGNMCCNASATE